MRAIGVERRSTWIPGSHGAACKSGGRGIQLMRPARDPGGQSFQAPNLGRRGVSAHAARL